MGKCLDYGVGNEMVFNGLHDHEPNAVDCLWLLLVMGVGSAHPSSCSGLVPHPLETSESLAVALGAGPEQCWHRCNIVLQIGSCVCVVCPCVVGHPHLAANRVRLQDAWCVQYVHSYNVVVFVCLLWSLNQSALAPGCLTHVACFYGAGLQCSEHRCLCSNVL